MPHARCASFIIFFGNANIIIPDALPLHETHVVSHVSTQNTILSLKKQVLWQHDTPERIETDNGTHYKNSLINTWAKDHGIEWIYHVPYHAPASVKIERYNGLQKPC